MLCNWFAIKWRLDKNSKRLIKLIILKIYNKINNDRLVLENCVPIVVEHMHISRVRLLCWQATWLICVWYEVENRTENLRNLLNVQKNIPGVSVMNLCCTPYVRVNKWNIYVQSCFTDVKNAWFSVGKFSFGLIYITRKLFILRFVCKIVQIFKSCSSISLFLTQSNMIIGFIIEFIII